VAINDALPLKAVRRNAVAKLKSFEASNLSCNKPNAVSFRFDVGRYVYAA